MTITKQLLQTIRTEIDVTLAPLAKKYGITLKAGNASYTAETASMKIEFATIGTDGVAKPKESVTFAQNAIFYGLKPTDLGRIFTVATLPGEQFKIIGDAPRATKFPILAERTNDGRRFKFNARTVIAGLK